MAKEKVRGFEVIADWAREVPGVEVKLPQRATKRSAAYDIFALTSGVIEPGQKAYFPTDIKAYMSEDEVLHVYPRSSQGIKLDLMLSNTIAVIDSDYYNNPTNDGHIGIYLRNLGDKPVTISIGDRIAQAQFMKYLIADHDNADVLPERTGGVGHTGR